MIRYDPTEPGQTEPLTGPQASVDGMGELYAREAEMERDFPLISDVPEYRREVVAAPGTEPPRQVRDSTPGVYVFLAGVGYGVVMGIALTVILGGS